MANDHITQLYDYMRNFQNFPNSRVCLPMPLNEDEARDGERRESESARERRA